VCTTPTKLSDITPGPRPAPELARFDRHAARDETAGTGSRDDAGTASAVDVLAEMIAGRDGAADSASQTWRQALSGADHLAVLHAMWTQQTATFRDRRYRALLQFALPDGHEPQHGHKEQWLHRTLRAVELGGHDASQVLARAVAERDLTGARDIAAVIDARIRRRYGDLAPLPARAWSAQVPQTDNPEQRRFLTQLAEAMDDRQRRIGEHAAASSPPWAVAALGAVPDDPATRHEWQRKAAAIGAYRELSGYNHPDDPIGPERSTSTPDLRAAWHEASAALGAGHRDASHMTNGGPSSGCAAGTVERAQTIDLEELSRRVEETATRHRELVARLTQRFSLIAPTVDTKLEDLTPAFPLGSAHRTSAILQPPKPEMPPSAWILDRTAERDLDLEAGA
jgi:hypothetical protein